LFHPRDLYSVLKFMFFLGPRKTANNIRWKRNASRHTRYQALDTQHTQCYKLIFHSFDSEVLTLFPPRQKVNMDYHSCGLHSWDFCTVYILENCMIMHVQGCYMETHASGLCILLRCLDIEQNKVSFFFCLCWSLKFCPSFCWDRKIFEWHPSFRCMLHDVF